MPARSLYHELGIISETVSNTGTLVLLPPSPLAKEKWASELESHFNTDPRLENNPWLHVFGKLVERGKFKEEHSGNYSQVGDLEESDVSTAIKELKGPACADYLSKRNA
jgi:hypothetical protein